MSAPGAGLRMRILPAALAAGLLLHGCQAGAPSRDAWPTRAQGASSLYTPLPGPPPASGGRVQEGEPDPGNAPAPRAGASSLAAAGGAAGGEGDGSGLGGTGHRGGIGGTGLRAEGGLGGTGIVGTVTAFGSIVVQGRHVALPADVRVREEDRPADTGRLRVGQVVSVLAIERHAGHGPVARVVRIRYAVEGPVTTVRRAGRTVALSVAGQAVRLAPGALIEGGKEAALRPGRWVRVSGLRRADGSIRATYLLLAARAPDQPRVAVRGVPEPDGAGRLRIGELRLAVQDRQVRPGLPVRLVGHLEGGRLRVAAVEPDRLLPDGGAGARRVMLEAFVQRAALGLGVLRVGGLPVRIGPQTRIVGGDLGSLTPDRLVRVVLPSPSQPLPEPPEAERIEVLDEHAEPLSLPVMPGELSSPGVAPVDELPGHGPDGMAGPPEAPEPGEPPESPEMPEDGEPPETPEAPEGPEGPEAPEAGEVPDLEDVTGGPMPEPLEMPEMPERDD